MDRNFAEKLKHKLKNKLKSNAGESIAEALIATLVAVLGITMLAGAIVSSVHMVERSRDTMGQYYAAENALASRDKSGSKAVTEAEGEVCFSRKMRSRKADDGTSQQAKFFINQGTGKKPVAAYQFKAGTLE